MTLRIFALLLCLAAEQTWACSVDGAFGIPFGSKVGFWARQVPDPQLPGPYHKAWSAKAPEPDPRFDTYLVRALEEDKLIYEIIGLQTIDPALGSSDDYATRLEPVTLMFMQELSQKTGLEFRSSMRGWHSAQDESLEYEVRHHRAGSTDYIMVGCTNKQFKAASVQKSTKAWLECENRAKSSVNNCITTGNP